MPSAAITLLVPCYNAAAFLPRLVESVRGLTQPFTRILCYDDGSQDNTCEVAQRLGWEILRGTRNRGAGHARNELARAATSDWIHFHDADDLLAPTFIEHLAPWCDDRHDIVSCDADWLDDATRTRLLSWRYDPAALTTEPLRHLLTHPMSLNNSVIRRSAWNRTGGCDPSLTMWEDADIHVRLARDGARFHHVPQVLTQALRRKESFSHDYRRSWKCRLAALDRYASDSRMGHVRITLAGEAENAAAMLAQLGEKTAARQAVALCRRLGGNPPTSRHPVVRLLKPLVPAHVLLGWQARRRAAHHA